MSLPRYPEYKDSRVAWLGEVPGHWEVKQGRRLYSQKRDSALPTDEQLSATQKYGVVPQRLFMELEDQKVTLALSGLDNFKHVEKDDFVISLRSFQGGIERSKYSGCVSPAYTVLRPACQIEAGFMSYLLKSAGYIAALQTVTDGIRDGKNISYEQFGQIGLPFPVFAEQQTIAAFLDCETGKTNALITEQQRLVALLAEKRQAVISHVVTKGLNPNARMKDSGIEWLGEVPEHWEVSRIKYVARIGNGSTPNRDNLDYWTDGDYPWLNSSVVNQDKITEAEQFVTRLALKECHLPIITPPVVLVGITGQGRTRGMAATLMFEATINQHVAYVKPDECRLHIDFLRRVFDMAYQYLRTESDGTGSTKGAITCEQIARLEIPLPSLSEQKTIVAYLDAEAAKFDTLTAEANRAIALLQERCSALISAAVTGKIDVRTVTLSTQASDGQVLEAA